MGGYIARAVFLLGFFVHCSANHECFLGGDIAVVFDFGPNITDNEVEDVWTFFDKFIDIIEEDPDTRVALLSYSNDIRARSYLNDMLPPNNLRQLRDFYTSITDFTATTHRGLLLMETKIFTPGAGDRPDKPNLALILTNRQTSDFEVMSERAKRLKDAGVIIYIICIGGISDEELMVLASSYNHTVKLDSFQDLIENATDQIKEKAFNCMNVVFVARRGSLENVFNSWSSEVTINENIEEAVDIFSSFPGLYKSHLIQEWNNLEIKQVKVAVYSNGMRKAFYVFNGTDSDKFSWFHVDRLIMTSAAGLVGATTNFFSIEGHAVKNRRFFISSRYLGCTADYGWLVVIDTGDGMCEWSERTQPPYFLYSPSGSAINWKYAPIADVFVVSIRIAPTQEHI